MPAGKRPTFRAIAWRVAVGLAVLGAGVGAYFIYRGQQAARQSAQAMATLRTEVIRRGNLIATVSATGALLAEQQVNLFFLAPGTVAEVLVTEGDPVRAGQPLARLESTNLQAAVQQATDALAVASLNRQKLLAGPAEEDIAVAEANLRGANAALADLIKGASQQDIQAAQIKYDNTKEDCRAAAEALYSAEHFSEQHPNIPFTPSDYMLASLRSQSNAACYQSEIMRLQLQQVKRGADKGSLSVAYARVAQAKAVLDQVKAPPTEAQIARADLAITQAQLGLDQAQLRLQRAELLAPFAGVVATVNIKAGEPAAPGTPAVGLVDAARFHLDVLVDEADVVKLAEDQPVSVTVDALPGVLLGGRVERLAPLAVVTGGVVNYTVRLQLDPTAAAVRPGMSATAEIVVAEVQAVLLAPNWAIRRDRQTGQAYVSLQTGDRLTEVAITTGLRGEAYTEIIQGVAAGDVAAVSTDRSVLDMMSNP